MRFRRSGRKRGGARRLGKGPRISRARRFWGGAALAASVTVTTLVLADIAMARFTSLDRDPAKVGFLTVGGFGHCYRSRDPELPIDFENDDDRRELERGLFGTDADLVREHVTRCVKYDLRKRRLGSHPERSHQVAIVGDSFAFGEGVKEEGSLGFLLSEQFPAVNFANFASSGAGVLQVNDQVERALADYRAPTDIVYFYNINDILMTDEVSRRFSYVMDFQNVRWNEVHRDDGSSWLSAHSSIMKLLDRASFMRRMSAMTTQNYLDMYFAPSNARARAESVEKIREMAMRCRERGVGFWVVLYPLLYKDALGNYPFESIHRMMMKVAMRAGAGAVDGARVFDDQRRMTQFVVDPGDFHPNRLANRKVAEYLGGTPGFLSSATRSSVAAHTKPLRLPLSGLTDSAPGVVPESASSSGRSYVVGGAMLSVEIEPTGTSERHRLVLDAHATGCRDDNGETWPLVGLYIDDRKIDAVRIASTDPGRFESTTFVLPGRATLRLVFLNDYSTGQCDRNVFLDSFDIARVE